MKKKTKRPYSLRALKAIEGFVGSRDALAKELGCSSGAINFWHRRGKVSPNFVLKLSELSDGKFTVQELLGSKD